MTSLRFFRQRQHMISRCFSSEKKCMITTPIFYVNAGPHIGHLYSVVLADALARWKDCTGIDRVFTTGTDEHGLKIQQAASSSSSNAKTIDFCNHVSGQFQSLFNRANIDYDAFIRTTDAQHGRAVMSLWKNLESRGMISMGEHRSWYSTSDESFLTPMQVEWDEVVGKMKSKESGHVVEQISEENYKFHLSHFRERLLQWLDDNPSLIVPASRANEVRSILEQGLSDLSISRLESKVQWAIGVPGDPDQVIYVWLDALTNYLTAAQYPHDQEYFDQVWPPDYQIIGKDILKFHAIYWPAFLMAANLPLPRKIVVHPHWTVDGIKMSKSLQNVVNPHAVIDKFGLDGVRYFLLREASMDNDSNFSQDQLRRRYNSELADNLGNLLSRCTATNLIPRRDIPVLRPDTKLQPQDQELIKHVNALGHEVHQCFEEPNFRDGISRIHAFLQHANRYFTNEEPWKIAKRLKNSTTVTTTMTRAQDQARLDIILALSIESCRVASTLLQPIIPTSAKEILDYLAVPLSFRTFGHAHVHDEDEDHAQMMIMPDRVLSHSKSIVIFPKLD